MICTSMEQAVAVAVAGARKMTAQGYKFEEIAGGTYYQIWGGEGQEKSYFLETDESMVEFLGGEFCDCPFARANKEFGVCKHSVWLTSELAEQAKIDAEATARQDGEDDQSATIAERAMRDAGIPAF